MSAPALLLCAALWAVQGADPVGAALERGEYGAALSLARALPEPLLCARAEVEVRYHAGDLRGARRAALAGLRDRGEDAALAARLAELCTSLRDVEGARLGVATLRSALQARPSSDEQRDAWRALLARRERELAGLERGARESSAALARARWTALLVLGLGAALVVALARGPAAAGARPRSQAGGGTE